MGQDQPVQRRPLRKESINRTFSNSYPQDGTGLTLFERDPRLVEQILFIPELFAGKIDAEIKKVERLLESMPPHLLESEIVDGINERFSQPLRVQRPADDVQQMSTGMKNYIKQSYLDSKPMSPNTRPPNKQPGQPDRSKPLTYFYEISTQELFIELLKKLQHWFYIEKELNDGLRSEGARKITVRKKVIPNYESRLDRHLFSKLYLRYYLLILKKNYGAKSKERKSVIADFHNSIGQMICQMIEHNQFNETKLEQLAYKVIYLEKVDTLENLERTLDEIKEEFWPFYLTKEHNLTLQPHEYQRVRQVARCYLDQLYLRSLKQAEDPDIITDPNEGFMLIRSFPIVRVRQDRNK